MLAAFWWVLTTALGLTTMDPQIRIFLSKVEWLGIVFVPVGWLLFTLEYTGREKYVTFKSEVLLSILPTTTLVLAMTNSLHGLLYSVDSFEFVRNGHVSLLLVESGPWFWIHSLYTYLLLVVGIVLVVQMALESRLLYLGQITALLLMVLPPIIANIFYITGALPIAGVDPTPFTFVITGVAGIVALTRYQFLDSVPVSSRLAQNTVLDSIDAGVIVVDSQERILDVNPVASEILSVSPTAVLGTDAASVIPRYTRLVESAVTHPETISIETGGRTRYYETQVTPIQEQSEQASGHVVVLYDVTNQRNRSQRLDVLNRVLRHNLRNEMNVVYGYADRLGNGGSPTETEQLAAIIKAKAMSLVELSDKARSIDDLVQETDGPPRPQPIAQIFEWIVASVTDDYPDVTVETTVPDERVHCDQAVDVIVGHILDNAIEHNDTDSPTVSITATFDSETITIRIADNGPGIPENDRTAIGRGVETELEHGSGLGLWLANWGAQSLGGSIDISDNYPEGTIVRITVPRLQPAEQESSVS